MHIRLPWLLSRKRLLAAFLIDILLITIIFISGSITYFGGFTSFSLPFALTFTIWLLIGYVIGRYQTEPISEGLNLFLFLSRTMLTLLLCIGTYYLSSSLFTFVPAFAYLPSFYISLLLVFAISSTFSQYFFIRFVLANSNYTRSWIFLGDADTFGVISSHLTLSRLPVSLAICNDLNQYIDQLFDTYTGILVHDFARIPTSQQQSLLSLQQKGTPVYSLTCWCEQFLQRFPPELLTHAELLHGDFSVSFCTIQQRLKRLGDVLVSLLLFLPAVSIIFFSSIIIFLQDGGPVFYCQMRCGLGGVPFRIWKLRTMRVDAEQNGVQWFTKGDSRVTPFGHLLRLTRLDELPQLSSVLLGKMSLIGPRPERPEFERILESQIPHYRLRYLVRPGLSGWAQVNYPYGSSLEDASNKLSYDLFYLRNFSFWLDLLILFKTIRLILNAEGSVPLRSPE